ncbi:MAG: PQQ-binding-like beta-propeller repeat protein [Planctomycetes bacterium]|nr:PQQ-binding-like beta-propeller repeat protein [Planctomycetota bacterium]
MRSATPSAAGNASVPLEQRLFVGTHGFVAALEQATGRELWRTSLPDTGYSIVTLLLEAGFLFAASGGHCFALDPESGAIAWHNELKGLGQGALCLATTRVPANASADPIPQHAAAAQQQAAASGGAVIQ